MLLQTKHFGTRRFKLSGLSYLTSHSKKIRILNTNIVVEESKECVIKQIFLLLQKSSQACVHVHRKLRCITTTSLELFKSTELATEEQKLRTTCKRILILRNIFLNVCLNCDKFVCVLLVLVQLIWLPFSLY